MKRYIWLALYTIPVAFGGLLIGAILMAGINMGFSLFGIFPLGIPISNPSASWAIALVVCSLALRFGALPVLLYGAPAYALLLWFRRAGYVSASVLAAVPALALLIAGSGFSKLFLLFGIPVACCTHFLAKGSPRLQQMSGHK